jgi:uncharacterized protein YbjT (DUF2867 family)
MVGDLDRPETIRPALESIERVFLLTSKTQQDISVITAAMSAGTRHIVKLSSQEAGWNPVEGHGHWHHEREELIRSSGVAWTFLRPSMYMSTALQRVPTIKKESAVYFPGGTSQFAPVDTRDVAAVACTALLSSTHEGHGYELTGPELISIDDMASILSGVLGKAIKYVDIPETTWGEQMLWYGVAKYVVDGLVETFGLIRKGRFAYLTDDIAQAGKQAHNFESWCREHRQASLLQTRLCLVCYTGRPRFGRRRPEHGHCRKVARLASERVC